MVLRTENFFIPAATVFSSWLNYASAGVSGSITVRQVQGEREKRGRAVSPSSGNLWIPAADPATFSGSYSPSRDLAPNSSAFSFPLIKCNIRRRERCRANTCCAVNPLPRQLCNMKTRIKNLNAALHHYFLLRLALAVFSFFFFLFCEWPNFGTRSGTWILHVA